MARKRMIDPSFWEDEEVATLVRDERLLLLGCVQFADDDGRLKAHPTYLRSSVFMYDADFNDADVDALMKSILKKMESWHAPNIWRLVPYQNQGGHYLFFPHWSQHQRPQHPTPSRLPSPPQELIMNSSGEPHEDFMNRSGEAHEDLTKSSLAGQSSLGQSSLGQSRLGKGSIGNGVPFSQLLTDLKKTDLTDLTALQGALTKAGESSEKVAVELVLHVWEQIVGGKYTAEVFNEAAHAVRTYPPGILAQGLLKAHKYHAKKWSYVEKCLQEMLVASHK